jgi:RNA polymerase sigma-70 factor (ECF subfamily)
LESIYALHTHDWLELGNDFGDEAFYLAGLPTELILDNAEVLGLAALIAFNHARKNFRIV